MSYFGGDFDKIKEEEQEEEEELEEEEEELEEEEEEEEENTQNEEPIQPIDSTFKNLVLLTKKSLYKNIILKPALNTKKAQDNTLLVLYLKKLTSLHKVCLHVKYNTLNEEELHTILKKYPNETRHLIKTLIKWIKIFFNKNSVVEIIPYTDYLETQLHRHPLLQK